MSESEIQLVLDRINEIVTTTNATDFKMVSFAHDSLLLTASFDHCYYHELEVHFHDISYIELPVFLNSPRFSIATEVERQAHLHLAGDHARFLIKIHNDLEFYGGHFYFIAAERIEIIEGTVYYYIRDNLKPGERIAEWVKRDG